MIIGVRLQVMVSHEDDATRRDSDLPDARLIFDETEQLMGEIHSGEGLPPLVQIDIILVSDAYEGLCLTHCTKLRLSAV
jgi:hypothetical protein